MPMLNFWISSKRLLRRKATVRRSRQSHGFSGKETATHLSRNQEDQESKAKLVVF
jgi:hypothetical protein